MGNILGAIDDDIKEYVRLCHRYQEKVENELDHYGNETPACYGEHARKLKDRFRDEMNTKAVPQHEVKSTEEVSAPEAKDTAATSATTLGTPNTSEMIAGEPDYSQFTVRLEKKMADSLKACFPGKPSITFIQVALTILNWVRQEEKNGRVILSATPEGTDVTRLVFLEALGKDSAGRCEDTPKPN